MENGQKEGSQPKRSRKKAIYGSGSVYYRQSDKRYVAAIKDPDTGKRIERYAKTRREAEKKLEDLKFEIRQGTLATGPNQTVKQFLENWLQTVYRFEVRESSYAQRETLLNKHILPEIGHLQLRKLSAMHIQRFYTKKLQEGLKPATVASFHSLLHKALNQAVRWKLLGQNVCDQVTPPSLKDQKAGTALTLNQAALLLKACQGHKLEAFITLALLTGMRHGELNALRWDDINFEEGYLQVRRTVGRISKKGFVERAPKTRKSEREIALPKLALEVLEKQRLQQQKMREQAGDQWHEQNLVFSNLRGGFLSANATVKAFHQLLQKAGLPQIRIHDLRHTISTLLRLEMEQPEKQVQELLGHETIEMGLRYTHVTRRLQQRMMEEVEHVFRRFL